jgi:transcriptional antiterminator RfaH
MFVAFDIQDAPWRKINNTMGVSKLVSFNSYPKPVPIDLVSGLMLRCDVSGKLLPPTQLNKGDEVQFLNGPFANFITTVEEIDAQQRVWVLMKFMGRPTRISVNIEGLKITK